MQSKVWQSKKNPIDYFEENKTQTSFLLLSKTQESVIGLTPIDYFYSLEAAESFLASYPDERLLGFCSYPDTKKNFLTRLPKTLWIRFQKIITIHPGADSYEYKESIVEVEGTPQLPVLREKNEPVEFYPEQNFATSITKNEYIEKILQIKEDISAGEYYQANFTMALKKTSGRDPYQIFKTYFKKNPSNYFAFFVIGDVTVVSTSPELFLRKENCNIIAQPIKGTLSKERPVRDLLNSQKDLAELNMITDLFRNDFYRICKRESVKVTKSKEVIEMENLYHLYSEVRGEVKEGLGLRAVIDAVFPSGSITGCPKLRSQLAIDSYENHARGLYTGSIGWLKKDSFCLNIAIRTILHQNQMYYYQVGSGIVYDSDPIHEWNECLLKAKTFLEVL